MSRLCCSPRTVQASRVKHATHLQQTQYHITPTLHAHSTPATDTYHTSHTCTPAGVCPEATAQPFTLLASVMPPRYALAAYPWCTPPAKYPFISCASCHAIDHRGSGLPHMKHILSHATILLTTLSVPPRFPHHISPSMPYTSLGQPAPCPELCLMQGTTA